MDQASALPAASCARNPAAPRTLPSWLPSEGQARTVVPSHDGSAPQSGPHSEPVHIVPHPSSPALCQSDAKGYLLPDDYSGATGIPGRFSEGLLVRRLQVAMRWNDWSRSSECADDLFQNRLLRQEPDAPLARSIRPCRDRELGRANTCGWSLVL